MKKQTGRIEIILLICILIIGIFLRFDSTNFSREIVLNSDSAFYYYAAKSFSEHGVLAADRMGQMYNGEVEVEPSSLVMPGLPILISMVLSVWDSVPVLYLMQIGFSVITLLMIYMISKTIGVSTVVSLFVTLLAAVYPGFCYNQDFLLTEITFTGLLTISMFLFLLFNRSESHRKKIVFLTVSTALLMCAVMTRAQALPFVFVYGFIIFVYSQDKDGMRDRVLYCSLIVFIALMFFVPLWIRNWKSFGEFYLLTEAGDNPKLWGAQPYYLQIFEAVTHSYEELVERNLLVDSQLYWKWRIFGSFNFMWYDFWDENLYHPGELLRNFRMVHLIVVVPTVAAIPLVVRKAKPEILVLASAPLLFSLMCLPYHGLPRYVFPAVPCVFVITGVLIEGFVQFIRKKDSALCVENTLATPFLRVIDGCFRGGYLLFSLIFSSVLIFSVYFFADDIKTEMSDYRLERTYGIDVSDVDSLQVLESYEIEDDLSLWSVSNVIQLEDGTYQGVEGSLPILMVQVPVSDSDLDDVQVITKVELIIPGGYFYDQCTVYWTGDKTETFNEEFVYGRFPRNRFDSVQTVYIDENVSSLMVVPTTFRGTEFAVEGIHITKYLVPETN